MYANPDSGCLDEGLGRADQAARRHERYVSILMILGFWVISNRGKVCDNC